LSKSAVDHLAGVFVALGHAHRGEVAVTIDSWIEDISTCP
jgi:hypothetical protein